MNGNGNESWYYQAYDVRRWLDELPWRTHGDAAKHFNIERRKIRELVRISDLICAGVFSDNDVRRYSFTEALRMAQGSDIAPRGAPRLPASPVARGRVYRDWLDANPGKTQADAAKHFGVGEWRVSQELKLLSLPPKVQRHIEEGRLSVQAATKLRREQEALALIEMEPPAAPAEDEAAKLRVELTALRVELERAKQELEAQRRDAIHADNEARAASAEAEQWKKIADATDLRLQSALDEINSTSYAAAAWKSAAKKYRCAARNYHSEGLVQSEIAKGAREKVAYMEAALRKLEDERRAKAEQPREKRFSFSIAFKRD